MLRNRRLGAKLFRIAVLAGLAICPGAALDAQQHEGWKFAVSGDSRNCGDIVMPAIAAGVRADGAAFYWHLGDYRAISHFDEDYGHTHPQADISQYETGAWPDFIRHQLAPFGDLPVFLTIGNHEVGRSMTRAKYIAQFAEWLDQPAVREQRLADNPADTRPKTYYHWSERGVDFISMDNASKDMFDEAQMAWLAAVLARDAKDPEVRAVVVGMHAALPDSLSAGHSMNDSRQEQATGRNAYAQLAAFRAATKKKVYVLASHSHLVMNEVYNTACHKGEVLPGWIMGSAGAVRYRLPAQHAAATVARTDVYGYLLATVAADGSISFQFREVGESDVPAGVVNEFSRELVKWCFGENRSDYIPAGPSCGGAGR